MTASTYQNHVIVCGVGKVGYRVINELVKMGELVVGIEEETNQMFVQELIDRNIPIIVGNIRVKSVLEKANVRTAKSVLCVTSDDLTNLDCAFTVREIKPDVHVVVRIFDDTIARKISSQFHLPAISTSHAAAPVFVAQALGHEAPQLNSIMVFGQQLGVSNMEVAADADGKTIANLETALRLKVVGGANKGGESIMPLPDYVVKSGDKLMVVALQR